MKNFVQKGENITVTAPATVASGEAVQIGDLFGIANGDAATGEALVLSTVGVFTLPKATTDALTVGMSVHWDDTAKEVTATDTGNLFVGHAVTAAGDPSATVQVRLSV